MSSSTGEIELLSFNVNGVPCGMDILYIHEIIKFRDITQVPRSPGYVEGILNLRGTVVTIINLSGKLGLNLSEKKKENQIIIVVVDDEYIGLMVDDVHTVMKVDGKDIGPVPGNVSDVTSKFFKGVLSTEDQLIGFLKISELLEIYD